MYSKAFEEQESPVDGRLLLVLDAAEKAKASIYKGKIKIVCEDLMCFPADPVTLGALACSAYDPWAISDPEEGVHSHMSYAKWCLLRSKAR